MIYLIYGDDTYRSWQKLQSIKAKYLDASMGDTDLAMLEGAAVTSAEFRRQITTLPFLAKSRLVIIKNLLIEGKKEVSEAIIDHLKTVPKTTVLFFYESGSPDKRLKLFKALNQPKQAQEFGLLDPARLMDYAKKELAAHQISIEPPALQRLTAIIGPDLWRLHQEIEKLSLFKQPANQSTSQPVNLLDIEHLIAGSPEARIFDLTDAFGQRDRLKALRLLQHFSGEEEGLGLLAMIAGQYRNLLLVSDGLKRKMPRTELNQQLKLHPFVFDKTLNQARTYDYNELVVCYRYLYQLDLAAKQSLVEPIIGLATLADSLATQPIILPDLTEEKMI